MSVTGHGSFALVSTLVLFITLFLSVASDKEESVVIIGAGAAGLAAATRLLEHNLRHVTVLEAENRIGGRVNSVAFGDAIVELGAAWCHGQTGNVVYELVKDLDLLEQYDSVLDIVFFNGMSLSKNHSVELMMIYLEVSHAIDQIEDKDISTADAFIPAFKKAVETIYKDNPEMLNLALQSIPLMENSILSFSSSFSWHNSSASKGYRECPGKQSLTWKGRGFKQIFDIMSNKLSKNAGITSLVGSVIHLNKVVSKIDYSGDKLVVSCTDGSEYQADFVVFTPSLGVLKHDHKKLFYPALSEKKAKAIEDLGIDAVMKIWLYYNDIWWPSDLGALGCNFVFTEEDEKKIANVFRNVSDKDSKSWITSILGFYPEETNPHVISFWIVGPIVPIIEAMSQDQIQSGIFYLLTEVFLHSEMNITEPNEMIITNWYTNLHFRGCYSYETIRSQREHDDAHTILAEPVKNVEGNEVLCFAGEATNPIHYSTVHGAIESGYREADRILKNKN